MSIGRERSECERMGEAKGERRKLEEGDRKVIGDKG